MRWGSSSRTAVFLWVVYTPLFLVNSACPYTLKIHEQHFSLDENLNILTPGTAKARELLQSILPEPYGPGDPERARSLFRTTDVLWTVRLTAE